MLASPLAKGRLMLNEDIEGNTKIVLQFINEHPGCHLRQVRNEVGISMGTAQYHLARLEKAGRITSNRRGLFKYYFPIGLFQDNEKNLLEVLSQETAREILMFIIEQKTPTQTDIVGRIGVSPASISWHVSRLNEFGIITEVKEGKYKRYQLRGDPKSLISLMKSYYPSLWDRWSSRLAEMFLSLSPAEGKES
ncbi:MAG: winged helix-turn-helix transcriptional regulator [Nitrososphaera sp.]